MTAILIAAIALFGPLFVYRSIGPLDFWWWMTANLVILIGWAAYVSPAFRSSVSNDIRAGLPKKIALGFASAAVLYAVFFAGNILARKLFPFAAQGIAAVYDFKSGVAPARVWILMTLVIGPGEEIFWRAYLQRALSRRIGTWPGFLLATVLYAGVHAGSGNVMLILAALVCGLFWGWLYLRFNSITLNAVSHTTWDIAVFLLFPFA
jgi:membrane protease YdiL (CAAX protease family)